VLGGWNIRKFIQGRTDREPGLLEQANRKLLYIDEVNLLDDHTVDIILDVAASGILAVQMDGLDLPAIEVSFSLVGTMNPDEGALRPQLLDRFGLAVPIDTETDIQRRQKILLTVLKFEQESRLEHSSWIAEGRAADRQRATWLKSARRAWGNTEMSDEIAELCARVVVKFEIQSHRAEIELAKAARAVAALDGRKCVEPADVRRAAPYALSHRKLGVDDGGDIEWVPEDKERLAGIIPRD
jgi:magnesium chelatase subunit I